MAPEIPENRHAHDENRVDGSSPDDARLRHDDERGVRETRARERSRLRAVWTKHEPLGYDVVLRWVASHERGVRGRIPRVGPARVFLKIYGRRKEKMPPKQNDESRTRVEKIAKKKRELMDLAIKHKNSKKNVGDAVGVRVSGTLSRVVGKTPKLPVSGSEEQFTNLVWGSPEGIVGNNCYGYALGVYRDGGYRKLQPGELAGTTSDKDDLTQCATLKKRTLEDLATQKNGGYLSKPGVACTSGYYKIMSFVAPKKDYHFYRQTGDMLVHINENNTVNSIAKNAGVPVKNVNIPPGENFKNRMVLLQDAGLWTHKRGLDELTTKDASGKFIKDPRKANRDYGALNYTTYCDSFCIPTREEGKVSKSR